MTSHLPTTIIGGYLGAGKTTLVNQLLRNADGRRLAILVNEFGALPIDEDLIEAADDDLISIAGGCICCSFGSDLSAALDNMGERHPRPDHIVIEASGVAMPGAIAGSISLLDNLTLAGVFVLADAETIQTQLADEYIGDTISRQLKTADVIVMTKGDLVDDTNRLAITRTLQSTSPNAALLEANRGSLPIDVMLSHYTERSLSVSSAHADGDYLSHAINAPSGSHLPVKTIQNLAQQIATGGYGVIRSKGFLSDDSGKNWLIQTVGQRFEVSPYSGKANSQLVLIGLRDQVQMPNVVSMLEQNFCG